MLTSHGSFNSLYYEEENIILFVNELENTEDINIICEDKLIKLWEEIVQIGRIQLKYVKFFVNPL